MNKDLMGVGAQFEDIRDLDIMNTSTLGIGVLATGTSSTGTSTAGISTSNTSPTNTSTCRYHTCSSANTTISLGVHPRAPHTTGTATKGEIGSGLHQKLQNRVSYGSIERWYKETPHEQPWNGLGTEGNADGKRT